MCQFYVKNLRGKSQCGSVKKKNNHCNMRVVCVVEIYEAHSPRKLLLNHMHTQLCPTLCDPMNCSLSGSSVHGIRARILDGLPFPSLEDLSDSGTEPKTRVSPAFAGRFFTTEPPEKPQFNLLQEESLHGEGCE